MYTLANLKSFRTHQGRDLIAFERKFAELRAVVERDEIERSIRVQLGRRRRVWVDDSSIAKLQNYLGTLQVVLFAVCMDLSWPKVAASQFTAYMAMLNLSTVLGNKLAGPLTDAFSLPTVFIVVGVGNLALLLLLPLIDLGQTRRVLGEGD